MRSAPQTAMRHAAHWVVAGSQCCQPWRGRLLRSGGLGTPTNVAPLQDHLLEMLAPNLAERVFGEGEYLLRQGDQGGHLLYIVEGSVEVLLKLSSPGPQQARCA